jgi:hypothetical protein
MNSNKLPASTDYRLSRYLDLRDQCERAVRACAALAERRRVYGR